MAVASAAPLISYSFGHSCHHQRHHPRRYRLPDAIRIRYSSILTVNSPLPKWSYFLNFSRTLGCHQYGSYTDFRLRKFLVGASIGDSESGSPTSVSDEALVGEDAADFDLSEQKITSWVYFTVILGVVLFVLNFVWIDNSSGFGKAFVDAISGISDSHEVVMLILVSIFAIAHSGLASLRDKGEKLIGERAFRVLFAGVSLPLAVSTVIRWSTIVAAPNCSWGPSTCVA